MCSFAQSKYLLSFLFCPGLTKTMERQGDLFVLCACAQVIKMSLRLWKVLQDCACDPEGKRLVLPTVVSGG